MIVRRATEADSATLRRLYREFAAECPPPPYVPFDWDQEWAAIDGAIRTGIALLAEDDGVAVGFALALPKGPHLGYLSDLYVRPAARGAGVATALVHEVASAFNEQGVDYLHLSVDVANRAARVVYGRLGFREESLYLVTEVEALVERLGAARAPSFGSLHVQFDDERRVEAAARQFVPRLGRSAGTIVSPAREGWIAVYDELCDRDRAAQHRLAAELSDRLGAVVVALALEEARVVRFALFERGRLVDEYLSVPEYYGPLEKADALALAANPTLVARLTGADPARVRTVARTAGSPAELPPAAELLARIAEVMGLQGAGHGFHDAREEPGALTVMHG